MFESILRSIGDTVGSWLYLVAGALAFSEAAILVGMVLPGETALLVAGVFCNRSYGHLNLWVMMGLAAVCAVLGDSVGYEFGRKYGPGLRRSRLGLWVGDSRWSAVDGFIHRHGGKAVLLGRLTAVLRGADAVHGRDERDALPHLPAVERTRRRGLAPGCVLLGYAFASALGVVARP